MQAKGFSPFVRYNREASAVRVIAVTGGIGSGKSTLTALYRTLGAQVIDADAISRSLTAAQGEALPMIRSAFGDGVFHADGTLNRPALAHLVFDGDGAARDTLNGIIHPLVIRRTLEELERLRSAGAEVAIVEAPLLFEAGMETVADAVLCVVAPLPVRIRRVRGRDRLTHDEALRRIRSQNPQALNESLADYVLSTDAPYPDTRRRALALWHRMLADGPRRTPAPLTADGPAQAQPAPGAAGA